MDVEEIINDRLEKDGYAGLYNSRIGCCCDMENLAPCVAIQADCQAGYKKYLRPKGFEIVQHKSSININPEEEE